jgi:cell division protein FtsN
MKKPDFLTIAIIVVALAGLTFLIIKTLDVFNKKEEPEEVVDEIFEEPETENYFEEESPQEVEPSTPAATDFPLVPKDEVESPTGNFMVIAGSYRVKANAEKEVARLKSLGYANARVGTFNQGSLASVLVNSFDSKADASSLVAELKEKHGVDAYVQIKK